LHTTEQQKHGVRSFGSPIKSMVQRRNSINERKRANSGSGTEDEARPSVCQL